jgi:hypothetical protein
MKSRITATRPHDRKPIRRNPKRTGELSEAAFMLKASTLGFGIAKPWGDSERYDFILRSAHRLWRVQLKSTEVLRARGYDVQPIYSVYGKGKITYTAEDIDMLVAHIVPVDVWYVLPIEAITNSTSLRFYPDIPCKCARWEIYREAWHLIEPHPKLT